MIYAGIVAGGTGSRMGADRPKQFLEIGGRAILLRTIDRFLEVSEIDLIYTAVHRDWLGYTEKLAKEEYSSDILAKLRFIEGGSDRNSSVINIINAVYSDNGISDDDILLTHDAVRPFVSADIIRRNIIGAAKYSICTTAIPATDTILRSENGDLVTDTPDRSKLWQAQTPQSFRIKAFKAAYSLLDDTSRSEITDVCGVFTKSGINVGIVMGDHCNIKLTTPFDLRIADSLI